MNKYLRLNKYVDFIERKVFGWQRSYSQCGEDLVLYNLIGKSSGFYVDIGANDPRYFNNTYFFYKKGWRGINVEPNISKLRLFNCLRSRDINLNLGIGNKSGLAKFYKFEIDQLSTFSEDVSEEYLKMGHKLKSVHEVRLEPLRVILEKHLPSNQLIDIMSIDTEGYDFEVLKSNDWEKYRPGYIILESIEYTPDNSGKKLNDDLDAFMSGVGYKNIVDTHVNTIYKKERD